MAINRINETDLQDKLVSQLSNRPTDPRSAGGDNMTAQQVKARHDALGLLVKDKLNELIDALNNATVNGEPVTPLSDLITVVADGVSKSLTEWIEAKLTKDVTAGEGVHAYGVDDDGEQTMLPVSGAATEGAIPQYGTGGVLPVSDGTADGHAVAKGQMTAAITSAVNALSATLVASINAKYTKPGTGIPLEDLAQDVRDEIEGAVKASAAENYSALVGILSEAPKTKYKAGQRFLIGSYGVPDVGVLSVEDTAVSYTYTTDAAFEASLMAGTLQIGYFVLRPVEGKTNLEDYSTTAETNEAISDAIDILVDALVDGVMSVAEASYAESATYSQQADLANQINSDREIEDADTACPPIVFGTVGGNAEVQSGLMRFTELRGHTIKWNQLVNPSDIPATDTKNGITFTNNGDGSVTVSGTATDSTYINVSGSRTWIVGHKYLIKGCPSGGNGLSSYTLWQNQESKFDNGNGVLYTATKTNGSIMIRVASGTVISTPITFKPNYFDLTNICGAGNEPSTPSEFFASFPLPYYEYNPGTLLSSKSSSVDFVKRNQWDEEWEVGSIDGTTGANDNTVSSLGRSKNYTMVLPGEVYYASLDGYNARIFFYDANKNFLSYYDRSGNGTFTVPINACFIRFRMNTAYGVTYKNDICIYINWDTPGLPYVPYSKQHITLPNIELRSAGTAYDVLYQQGGGKRRAGTYTFDGTEPWYQGGSQTSAGMYRYYLNKEIGMKSGTAQDGLCSAFENLGANWNQSTQEGVVFGISNELVQFVTATAKTREELNAIFNSSVTIVFPLATETDITLEENPGWDEYAEIDNFGTVKFNQDPAQTIPVPQAYFVRYVVNLVEFLDSLFVHCGGDVTKLALVE